MYQHQGPEGEESLRPKGSRIDAEIDERQGTVGAPGGIHALHADAVLGLQRSAGNAAISSMIEDEERSPVHDVINSPGQPLDSQVRADMEGRLGADFGDVRVHDDPTAHASATAVNAHAYTVGSNIVFQRDRYDPTSTEGQTTLAHELTHVIQQRSGPVDGTSAAGGVKISDPSDRFEREAAANADRAMSAPPGAQAATPSGDGRSLQRDESPDEQVEEDETVQALFVQRQEADEEEEMEASGEGISHDI